MARRDTYRAYARPWRGKFRRIETVAVDRHRNKPRAYGGEGKTQAGIMRLLDHDGIAGIDQEPRADIECLLRTADDDDLVDIA